jgi:hypothetical protein
MDINTMHLENFQPTYHELAGGVQAPLQNEVQVAVIL